MAANIEIPPNAANLSVIVPVFRSEQTLEPLYQRLISVLPEFCDEFEIILVEDGGNDGSWDVIKRLATSDHRIIGLRHARNYGQHNALLTGIRAAKYEIIVTLDDDLQNPPEEIPKLLEKLHEGADVVYGYPRREQHGFLRDSASRITKMALQSAMGADTARNASAFRVFRTWIREAFSDYHNPQVAIDVLLTWGTTSFAACEVAHDPRRVGVSNYTFGKLLRHAANMMTGFSIIPLQIASLLGFIFTVFGMGLLTYVVIRYIIYGSSVAGFTFLASIISLFSGAQMFALGIIGEYLARMHQRSMGRPPSVVRERTDTAKTKHYS